MEQRQKQASLVFVSDAFTANGEPEMIMNSYEAALAVDAPTCRVYSDADRYRRKLRIPEFYPGDPGDCRRRNRIRRFVPRGMEGSQNCCLHQPGIGSG